FRQRRRDISFTLTRGTNRDVWPHVLEHDNPVSVLLINRRVQRQRDRASHGDVARQWIGHVPKTLDLRRPRHRHLRENIGLARGGSNFPVGSRWFGRERFPMRKIEFGPLRLGQWPIRSRSPLVCPMSQ